MTDPMTIFKEIIANARRAGMRKHKEYEIDLMWIRENPNRVR